MNELLWITLAFLSGSIPFSVLVGKAALRTDIRRYGDHNPGATNVLKAGGWQWGALALILDILKGAIPVGLAWYWGGVGGWPLVAVSLAPVLGHAFSPFLKFRGGKALAVSCGVWGGLTVGEVAVVAALLLVIWYLIVDVDGWAVMLAAFSLLAYLLAVPYANQQVLLAVWLGNTLILAWKHQTDLAHLPHLRSWFKAGQ